MSTIPFTSYFRVITATWLMVLPFMVLLSVDGTCLGADKRLGGDRQPRYRKQHAIIIGINYTNLSPNLQIEVPPLQTAEDDARAIHDILIKHYGFESTDVRLLLGKDATLQSIRAQFGTHFLGDATKVKADDAVLIFYAGHGERQLRQGKEDAYVGMLYPSDLNVIEGKGVDPVSCLRIDDILRMLQDYCAAKHKLLVLDSCHSGEVFNFQKSRSAGVNRGFRENLFQARALQAIAAAQATQLAADANASGTHSPFTQVLLDALAHGTAGDNASLFSASELFAFIPAKMRLMKDIRQDPRGGWLEGEGDFYFFPQGLSGNPMIGDTHTTFGNDSETSYRNGSQGYSLYAILGSFAAVATALSMIGYYRWHLKADGLPVAAKSTLPRATANPGEPLRNVSAVELYLQVQGAPCAYRAPHGAEIITIGRQRRKAGQSANEGNDFVIRDASSDTKTRQISRRHLEIQRSGTEFLVVDKSTAGTRLNSQALVREQPAKLVHGDQIHVADVITLEVILRNRTNNTETFPDAGNNNHRTQSAIVKPLEAHELELSPWNLSGVVVEATLGDLVTLERE